MANFKELIKDYFSQAQLPITDLDEKVLRCGYNGKNLKNLEMIIFFNDPEVGKIEFQTSPIATFGDDKLIKGLMLANQMNTQYRWIKFVIRENGDIMAKTDAIIDEATAGEETAEIVLRTFSIIDGAYPDIMKALWT